MSSQAVKSSTIIPCQTQGHPRFGSSQTGGEDFKKQGKGIFLFLVSVNCMSSMKRGPTSGVSRWLLSSPELLALCTDCSKLSYEPVSQQNVLPVTQGSNHKGLEL